MPPSEHELRLRERLSRLRSVPLLGGTKLSGELQRLQRQLDRIGEEPTGDEIWRSVELARHSNRPYTLDYVERLLDDWFELHGDRSRGDDAAMIAGIGKLDGRTVVLVGQQKGRDIHQRTERRFGMSNPEGYAKAMRAMELADRHGFPVVTLVDTPGAYPGVNAEQHGQGAAIANSQAVMARLTVPIVTCVIGEGGSGGAIAIALADRVLMQEHAIYSVISPEGCAMILWRDAGEAKKAAAAFKPDAAHCLELGVIDGIVPEPRWRGPRGLPGSGPDAERVPSRGARRARGRAGGRAPPQPPGEVPLAGRIRVGFCRFCGRLSTASTGLSPARNTARRGSRYDSRPVKTGLEHRPPAGRRSESEPPPRLRSYSSPDWRYPNIVPADTKAR